MLTIQSFSNSLNQSKLTYQGLGSTPRSIENYPELFALQGSFCNMLLIYNVIAIFLV